MRLTSRALLAFCVTAAAAAPAPADIVYLTDGTVLRGRVVQETQTFSDPATHQVLRVPKGNNVYAVYDGTRFITFSPLQLDLNRPPEKVDTFAKLTAFERKPAVRPFRLPPGGDVKGKLEFKSNGRRTIKIVSDRGPYEVNQILTFLSPYQMRVFSEEYAWVQNYLTAELDRDLVRSLAVNFPQIRDEKDPVEKSMKLYRFMVEARWYDEAARELDDIEQKLPEARQQVAKARDDLKVLRHEDTLDRATHALAVGQLGVCEAFLAELPRQGLGPNLNVKVNTLRVKVDGIKKQYTQALRYLRRLPDGAEGACAEVLCEAAAVLRDELHVEALDRLEPFVNLAEQAERAAKAGRVPADRPEQLLARAVSGWLLGKESSDARPEVARKLWRARQFAAAYIRTPLLRDRQELVARYEKDGPVEIEELARIIALLPPAAAEEVPGGQLLRQPQERKTDPPTAEYVIQLPPEYKPGRPYPLLVVLHHDNETPRKVLERYRYEAVRNGYILVAPEWGPGFGGPYQYRPDERQRVLDVIRDVRLHFHVDPDRIVLSGYGEGGNAAWDVGLSHPDLFAAVVPVAADPDSKFLMRYWPNAVHLPFYLVGGEYGGRFAAHTFRVMEFWINKGFPCLNVTYQGRGREWFHGELPFAFEWMSHRKRARPFPELGRWPAGDKTALVTMRPTNNQFYWLSVEGIKESFIETEQKAPTNPAQLQAIIRPGNAVEVRTYGLLNFTVWLAPGMIDFTRPVTVTRTGVGNRPPLVFKNVKPDLTLMMETFYERGDNTRLFVAKIPLTP